MQVQELMLLLLNDVSSWSLSSFFDSFEMLVKCLPATFYSSSLFRNNQPCYLTKGGTILTIHRCGAQAKYGFSRLSGIPILAIGAQGETVGFPNEATGDGPLEHSRTMVLRVKSVKLIICDRYQNNFRLMKKSGVLLRQFS
jgi:hypothetical protein